MGLSTYLLSWTRSTTDLIPPLGFCTKDIGEHHSETPSTFSMIPSLTSSSIFFLAASKYANGVFLGVQTFMTVTFAFFFMWICIGSPFIVRRWPSIWNTCLCVPIKLASSSFASSSVSMCVNLLSVVVFAALTGSCLTFGKVLSITPKFFSTLQLSKISSFMASETRALTSVVRPWYFRVNVTEPELSRRWALTALIFRLESGLNRMPFRIARLRAMIVFVHPVSGHAMYSKG